MKPAYQFHAASLSGFIQQLAVSYIGHGYYFYVTGEVSERKEASATDKAILMKLQPATSRATRSRRKLAGRANIHYLRHEKFFVIVSTEGAHEVFEQQPEIRDVRRSPIFYQDYSIGHTGGHLHVRIAEKAFLEFKAYMLDLAVHHSVAELEGEFRRRRYEPYAPIRGQVLSIWGKVNQKRKTAGLEPLGSSCLYLWRKPCKVFVPESGITVGPTQPKNSLASHSVA